MPIKGWLCHNCGGREVPLDHYEKTSCGETTCHPDYAAALLADRANQYIKGAVRVSHGLSCPRRAAIEESESFYVNPLESNAALTGTAWHALMEKSGPESECEVEVSGEIAGIKVNGKIDRIRGMVIEDWKHIGDAQIKYRKGEPAKVEHIAQTSIYAELCEQSGRKRPSAGLIWYHTSMGGSNALTPVKFDLMPIEEALRVKPYSGDYEVEELYGHAALAFVEDEHWSSLPLAGQSMKFGNKSACDYCAVRSICVEAENGAPF